MKKTYVNVINKASRGDEWMNEWMFTFLRPEEVFLHKNTTAR